MERAVVLNRPPYFEGGVYPGRPLNMAARRSLRLGPVFTGGGGAGLEERFSPNLPGLSDLL